jgi:hypothetical protein
MCICKPFTESFYLIIIVISQDVEWIKEHRKEQVKQIRRLQASDDVYLFHVRKWFAACVIQRCFRTQKT